MILYAPNSRHESPPQVTDNIVYRAHTTDGSQAKFPPDFSKMLVPWVVWRVSWEIWLIQSWDYQPNGVCCFDFSW